MIVRSLSERAYFQTGQYSVEFVKFSSIPCPDCYAVVDKKKLMLIKSETIGTNGYYVLYDYDAERKYVFFKDVVAGEPSSRGLLKAERDYYKNCWVYRYEEIIEFLHRICLHIPNHYESLIRYYGYYSNAARGKRNKTSSDNNSRGLINQPIQKVQIHIGKIREGV